MPPVPYLSLESLLVLLFLCPALCCWPNLLGRCFCGCFCVSATCVGFPQPPKLTLYVTGLCARVLASWAGLGIPEPVCTCFTSLPALFATGVICSFFGCVRRVVCAAQVCLPHHTWVPGPALVLQGLGALPGFVCRTTLGSPSPLSVWGHSP